MANGNATTSASAVCYHCNQFLTRPDINIRTSPIYTMFGCGGLAPSQIALANETVTATLADITQLDGEISRFRAAIGELKLKRTALQSFANAQKSLLSPISRLPAEVLSQIFQLCVIVPWTDTDIRRDRRHCGDSKTPMAISCVSRPWRDVALSTPRLWSEISLVLRPKDAKQHIALASMWLSRSGNSPLSIHLETQKNIRDPMREVMEMFAAKSPRWRNVHFKLPLPMLGCMSFIKSRLPILELLELEFWEEVLTKIDLFAHAPRLHTFFARGNVTRSTLALPWNLIQVIKINSDISLSSAIDLLALTPNIESCELRARRYDREPMPAHAIVRLPTLRSLSVKIYAIGSTPYALFHTLCMPQIHTLSLDRTLSMTDAEYKLAGDEMIQILKAAPLLQVLEVRDDPPRFISNDFLEAFSQLSPSGTPILCPNLQTICFRYFPSIKLRPFALALHARGSSDTQKGLQTVIIVYTTNQARALKKLRTSAEWNTLRDASTDLQFRDKMAHTEWS